MAAPPSAPLPKRVPKPRPYRDFLTPSLHRRFTNAATVGLVTCWAVAVLMAKPSLFWSWFPLGSAGARTLLLFISSLSVFILRVAQLHFGPRTATYPAETFLQCALSRKSIQTLFWYQTSALIFVQVYIFSTSQSANLSWVDPGRSYERPRLNERPVLLRSLFMILALAQSALHLYHDYDLVVLSPGSIEKATPTGMLGKYMPPSLVKLQQVAPLILQRSVYLVLAITVAGPLIYFSVLRTFAWTIAFKIGRSFFTLSKQVKPSGLTDVTGLMFRFAWSALLLSLIWEMSNQAFTIYTAQEPLKKGMPLTTDSKDPNGSLISGLKAKKDIPRTVAFWELNTITTNFPERRTTLYGDIDRTGGSTWTQILNICLAEIQSVSQRIRDSQKPIGAPPVQQPQQLQSLPRISQPLKDGNGIFSASPPAKSGREIVHNGLSAVAKHYGSSAGSSPASPVGAKAQKMLEYGSQNILGEEKRQQLSRANLSSQANGALGKLLRSPVGIALRRPFNRQINAIVFGVPHGNSTRIINAVQSICSLVVFSLKEDRLGQVQKDIAMVVRTLVATIKDVQCLLQTLPPHWTDVDFDGKRQVKEVDELLLVMRAGLEKILLAFGEYADQLGLSRTEVRLAKQLASSGPEMAESKSK